MLIHGIEYKIASNTEEIRKAYELVYENYIEKKFCNLNFHKMRIFLFDSLDTTRTFIAKEGDTVLATTTLVFDSPIGLPSETIYNDRLMLLRQQNKKICEISKLSSKRNLGAKALTILPYLFRTCWLYAKEINKHTHFCIMVEPQNVGFYQKYYYFENHSEIRLDHKANEASSILLEMPIDLQLKAENQKTAHEKKIFQMHFNDQDCDKIISEMKEAEANISKINISLLTPRKNRTLALSGEEKRFLEFKFFIIRYNLEQITKYAVTQSSKGEYHEAAESYERLMKTLPSWAFSKEKDKIYENLCDYFFTTGNYKKLVEMGEKLQKSTNQSASIQGRNMQALGYYNLKETQKTFSLFKEAEKMARELNDLTTLTHSLHFQAMTLNHQRKYEEALPLITEGLQIWKNNVPFRSCSYLFITAQAIFEHLGKIKECKQITQIFIEEVPNTEAETSYKILINYYTSLSRYYEISLNHSKAISCLEIILNQLAKKDEMPFNYAVHLSIYAKCLLEIGALNKALKMIDEGLTLKKYYSTKEFVGYSFRKLFILLLLNDKKKLLECKNEISSYCQINDYKQEETEEYQMFTILETHLHGNTSQILKLLPKLKRVNLWNKPHLSGEVDLATIYLLLNQPKNAIKLLEKKWTDAEAELIGSDIDNQSLIQIYLHLAKNNLEPLISDINKLWEINIQKDENLAKCLMLYNFLQIIHLQNMKKPHSLYLNVKWHLIEMFDQIVSNHDFPFFKEYLQNQKSSMKPTNKLKF